MDFPTFFAFGLDAQRLFIIALSVLTIAIGAWMWHARHQRNKLETEAYRKVVAEKKNIPATLYPVINPDICMGSLSCISACPEGDILGLVNGAAKLIEATHCIGHSRCESECPVGAIKLVFGTEEKGVELPQTDEFYESARAGVYIIGELGGMGLIKNALAQGAKVIDYIKKKLKKKDGILDVIVVGAGPSGLAAAIAAKTHGLSCEVVEQEVVGGTVGQYPRQKLVMSEPVEVPGAGVISATFIQKEELIAIWEKAIANSGVKINIGWKVEGITGDDGNLTVQTTKGELKGQKVILAIGRRGSPRKIGCKGEELPKVTYRLIDYEQYAGSKVLVMGAGDSAVEAAMQIARETDAVVTLGQRGEDFAKCKDKNRREILEMAEQKKLQVLYKCAIKEIKPDQVLYTIDKKDQEPLPNDYVIVCLGGELPTEFLKKAGVSMIKLYGNELAGPVEATDPSARARAPKYSAKELAERRAQMKLTAWLLGVGLLCIGALTFLGWDYYLLEPAKRFKAPLHSLLKPSGLIGHGVGIIATAVMLTNFGLVLRKRWMRLKKGSIRGWMTVHTWVGILAPPIIAFHTAFQSKNVLATATTVSMAVVTVTGLIGRFIFQMIPAYNGKALDLTDVMARWDRLKQRLEPLVKSLTDPVPVQQFLATATAPARGRSVLLFLGKAPVDYVQAWTHVRQIRPLFTGADTFDDFSDAFWRMWWLRAAVSFNKSLKRLMGAWRVLHVVLAIFLAVLISAHVVVEVYFGYRWIF